MTEVYQTLRLAGAIALIASPGAARADGGAEPTAANDRETSASIGFGYMDAGRAQATGFSVHIHPLDSDVFVCGEWAFVTGGGLRLDWFPDIASIGAYVQLEVRWATADLGTGHELAVQLQPGLFGGRLSDRLTVDGEDRATLGVDVALRLSWRIFIGDPSRSSPFFLFTAGGRLGTELTGEAELGPQSFFHGSGGVGLGGSWR